MTPVPPPRRLVVVGHGMAAHRLVTALRSRDRHGRWRVLVLGEEPHPAYDRIALADRLAGAPARDLALPGHGPDPLVEVRTRARVTAVDPAARTVRTADGGPLPYDALVLATGAVPFRPPVPGTGLPGCVPFRTLADADAIRAAAEPGAPVVVVGGGLLGLETADALRRRLGMRPHVVEAAPRLMPAQLDAPAARLLAARLRRAGLRLHCGVPLRSVDAGPDGRVDGVTLADGTRVPAGLVVLSAGVRPRDDLAEAAGLPRGERGGFLVDDLCRTPDPRVWAVGDCAALGGRCPGTVAPGYRMAESVAAQLLGEPAPPAAGAADTVTVLKVPAPHVAALGDPHPRVPGTVEFSRAEGSRYARLLLSPDARTLLGAVLVGHAAALPRLRPLIGRELTAPVERLLE
ncbi:hypothetical protein GCM10027168_70110 [Streptomyces capparidis]